MVLHIHDSARMSRIYWTHTTVWSTPLTTEPIHCMLYQTKIEISEL